MPAPGPTACTLQLRGMPVSVMRHHQVHVGDGPVYPAAASLAIELPVGGADVTVDGPRYVGHRRVLPADCEQAAAVTMTVQPRPASLQINCAYPGMTLECPKCAGAAGERIYLAEDFPPVEVDALETKIHVLFRAPGYQRAWYTLLLAPGHNETRIVLEPLAG